MFAKLSLKDMQIMRYATGLLVAIALAYGFDWPLAFLTPVLVAKFLGPNTTRIQLSGLLTLFTIIAAAFWLGFTLSSSLISYPVVFILVVTLILFWLAYWGNSGGNEIAITMLLVAVTLIPVLSMQHPLIAKHAILGVLLSCSVALVITLICNEIFVKGIGDKLAEQAPPLLNHGVRIRLSLLTVVMILPVLLFFLYFQLTGAVLVLIFIAILAQKPDFVAGVKGAGALLLGNSIGGLAAMIMFGLLLAVPQYSFALILYALVILIFSQYIFSERKLSPIYAMALTTVIIIISGSTTNDGGASSKFYIRLFQIALACGYIVLITWLMAPLINKIQKQNNYSEATDVDSISELSH